MIISHKERATSWAKKPLYASVDPDPSYPIFHTVKWLGHALYLFANREKFKSSEKYEFIDVSVDFDKKKTYDSSKAIFCEISSFAHLKGLNNSHHNPNV